MAETWDALPIGFLADVSDRIRKYVNEGSSRPKYAGKDLYPLIVGAYARIMTELWATAENVPEINYAVAVTADTQHYALPPAVGELLMVGRLDTNSGQVSPVIEPRGRTNPFGRGISVDGNMLKFTPMWNTSDDLVVVFSPSGHCFPHLSKTGSGAAQYATKTSLILDSSPDEGYFDPLPNAYVGCSVRIISALAADNSTPYIPAAYPVFPPQERVITSQTSASGATTVHWDVDLDFDPETANANGYYTYEIVPFSSYELVEAIAMNVSATIHHVEERPEAAGALMKLYHAHLRMLRQRWTRLLAQKQSLARARGRGSRYWLQYV